jgi:hypothetical protein
LIVSFVPRENLGERNAVCGQGRGKNLDVMLVVVIIEKADISRVITLF